MSIRAWLSRPLSRYLKFSWLSRLPPWPAGLARARATRPAPKAPPRPPVQLGFERMEARETPDDLLGVLTGGFALGGVALVNGQFATPVQVFMDGWNARLKGRVPAPASVSRSGAGAGQLEPAKTDSNLGLSLLPSRKQEQEAGPARAGLGSGPEKALGSPVGDDPYGWVDAVGAFLFGGSRPKSSRSLPETDTPNPKSSGGGGGGGFNPSPAEFSPAGGTAGRRTSDPANNLPLGQDATPAPTQPVPLGGSPAAAGVPPARPSLPAAVTPASPLPPAPEAPVPARLAEAFGRTPLPFEQNVGQADPAVRFQSRGAGFGFWLTADAMVFAVPRPNQPGGDVFRLRLVGANPAAEVFGRDELASRANYFVGADPSAWHANVPRYGRVEYRDVFPGVDLVLRAQSVDSRVFEYDFVVRPGASPDAVRLRFEGLLGVREGEQGRLLLRTGGGTVVQDAPVLYQDGPGGRVEVAGRVVARGNGEVGFEVTGGYDPSRPLVLDPALSFATYLGGSGSDKAYGVAVDAAGNSYVVGQTSSNNYPTQDGYQTAGPFVPDAFVTKVNAAGTGLAYSTFLGGSLTDGAYAVAVDPAGCVYVTGVAGLGFPTTTGAYQTSKPGSSFDGAPFVTKLNPSGDALGYSTFLGGGGMFNVTQEGRGVAVGVQGNAYVTGFTDSSSFPTTGGAFQASSGGGRDAFVSQLTADGGDLVYSSYLGGSGSDTGYGVALGASGAAFVAGTTASGNFPTTGGAYQTALSGSSDAFVVKVSADGTARTYATYLGGSGAETAYGLAVDRDGRAVATGSTTSSNYPTVAGAYQTSLSGSSDAFVTALAAAGTGLAFSTYLGGTGAETGYGVAVDVAGRPTVTGSTTSSGFPTLGAFQGTSGGGAADGFVTGLTTTGTLSYSSYLGGSGDDAGQAVALDLRGAAYVAGYSSSTNLPGVSGGYQASNGGGYDAFLAKVTRLPAPRFTTISSDSGFSSTDRVTTDQTLTLSGTAPANATVTLERAGVGVLGSVAANANGAWAYDYTGTTLPEGTHAFTARSQDSSGRSDYSSPEYLVTVDRTGPDVYLYAPSTTPSRGPEVRVAARDLIGVAAAATVALDVDKNNDGDFLDSGESGYATGTLTDGQVTLKLAALSSSGTYPMRARVLDLAGNEGTSSTASVVVSSVTSAWAATARALSADPLVGDFQAQLGDVSLRHPLDLDRSPSTRQGGEPALVYHSSSVSQKPIVQVSLPSVSNASLPSPITARLTFDGTAAATVTYSTSGFAPGDVFTLALQASNTITTTGRYGYSVLVQVPGQSDQTVTGSTYVVAQDASALGTGWTFAGVDRLVSISSDANGPAGQLRVYGTGGWRFYEGTSTFTSPTGDSGTLTVSGGTYTYSTPDGQTWTFNSSGYLTQWASADGKETLQYRYDGGNRLSGVTAIDGGLTTLTYTGSSSVAAQTVNSRTTTLTLSSGDLAGVANPDGGLHTFTYDGSHRLTQEQFGGLENNWAYTAAGTVGTYTWGAGSVDFVANPSRTTYLPASTQGLSTPVSGTVYASSTDPTAHTARVELDDRGRVLQAVAPDGGLTKRTYSSGYVATETDPLGRTTSYTRDGSGYVTRATLPDGAVVTYQYQSSFHALTTVVNERGNTMTFAYDGSGHLTRSTDALGNHTTYSYNATTGLLEGTTDPRGNRTTQEYDAQRRLTRSVDALGNATSYAYDANGNQEATTDALLRVTTRAYDAVGRVTTAIDALGNRTTYAYDAAGLLLSVTDPLGKQTSVVYDTYKRGLQRQVKDGVGSATPLTTWTSYDDAARVVGNRDRDGWTEQPAYDPAGRPVTSTDALGNSTRQVYDLAGQLVAQRDEMGRWTYLSYDSRGRVTQTRDNLGNLTTRAYDAVGNLTARTDALNRTTTYQYDADDRRTATIDPLGRRVTTSYDAAGNVSTVTDPMNRVTSYAYDALNRQTKVTEAVGTGVQRTSETSYDEVGNVKTAKDALGNVTTYAYDARNLQTGVQDPLGHRVTTSYDAVGQPTSVQDALGKLVTYAYDALHRRVGTQDQLGHRTTVVLTGSGQQAASVDALGNATVTAIDALGRPMGQLDALGGFSFSQLDGSGATRLLTDPVGNEWHYVFDGLGREAVRHDPAGEATTTAYDAVGRTTSVTDRGSRLIQYSYDNGDRVTAGTWKSAAGVTVNLLTFTYDDNDNRLTAKDSSGAVTYTYDELNRAKTYANVFGQVLTYSYDAEDRVTKREDSLGGVLTSVYDAVGNLTSRRHGGVSQTEVRFDFGYTARDEQSTITRYSDVAGSTLLGTTTYSRDDAARLTGIVTKNAGATTLSYYSYGYDDADRVTTHSWSSQIGTTTYSGAKTYTYDATNQLTNDSTAAYSYDANGNRTMAGYQTGTANRMSNDGVFTYTYDDEGNTLTKSKGAGLEGWSYTWDNANRLTNVRKTSDGTTTTLSVTYTYDVEGHRVQEDKWKSGVGSTTTRFAWDGQDLWADLDGSNALQVRYVHNQGIDQPLVRIVSSGTYAGRGFFLTDNIGTVRDVADGSMVIQYHADPDGFGTMAEVNPAWGGRFKFTAREYDADTGLQFNRRRWYSQGRWLTEDPITYRAGDANYYRYVRNDPARLSDPSGLVEPFTLTLGAGAVAPELLAGIATGTVLPVLGWVVAGGIVTYLIIKHWPQPGVDERLPPLRIEPITPPNVPDPRLINPAGRPQFGDLPFIEKLLPRPWGGRPTSDPGQLLIRGSLPPRPIDRIGTATLGTILAMSATPPNGGSWEMTPDEEIDLLREELKGLRDWMNNPPWDSWLEEGIPDTRPKHLDAVRQRVREIQERLRELLP